MSQNFEDGLEVFSNAFNDYWMGRLVMAIPRGEMTVVFDEIVRVVDGKAFDEGFEFGVEVTKDEFNMKMKKQKPVVTAKKAKRTGVAGSKKAKTSRK